MKANAKMVNKMLAVLSYWQGDRVAASNLTKLIADLEERHNGFVDFLIVHRFDCQPDLDAVKYLSRKFNVRVYRSPRRGVGWPDGCNDIWFGAVEWVFHMMEAQRLPHYAALLNLEADVVPMDRNWLRAIAQRWDSLNRAKRLVQAGSLVNMGGKEHVNAVSVITGDFNFLRWLNRVGSSNFRGGGWDFALAPQIKQFGYANMPEIKLDWNLKTFDPDRWDAERQKGTVLFHGCKDDSLLTLAREKLLTKYEQ